MDFHYLMIKLSLIEVIEIHPMGYLRIEVAYMASKCLFSLRLPIWRCSRFGHVLFRYGLLKWPFTKLLSWSIAPTRSCLFICSRAMWRLGRGGGWALPDSEGTFYGGLFLKNFNPGRSPSLWSWRSLQGHKQDILKTVLNRCCTWLCDFSTFWNTII